MKILKINKEIDKENLIIIRNRIRKCRQLAVDIFDAISSCILSDGTRVNSREEDYLKSNGKSKIISLIKDLMNENSESFVGKCSNFEKMEEFEEVD